LSTITFEPTQSGDADALVALRIEAMRESLERIGRFDPARARERFLSAFEPQRTRHVVCDGERVGFVVLKPQPQWLLLDHLYVRPDAQGRGIGAAVLADVFAQARRVGLPVRVGALRESASNRFYARHGFKLVERGEFDNYYLADAALPLKPSPSRIGGSMLSLPQIQELLDPLFPGLMGVRLAEVTPERVLAEMTVRADLCTAGGILHGGAYMAFADTLGAVGTIVNMPDGKRTTTTDSSTKFIGGARVGTTVTAECVALHRGRTTMVWQTSIRSQEGKLCAVVTQTQLVLDA
jgi:1,4-dihydroxy-2-naphthoyl-CoA hydrolase